MTHGGRPRRENEQPDSAFGKALKRHLQRVEDFTQTDVARETGIPERTLSLMVKGKRTSGTMLRRDLRDIISVLYQKKALFTLEEANQFITTIPAVSALDARDPEDAKIIALFDSSLIEIEQTTAQNNTDMAGPNVHASSEDRDDTSVSHTMPEFATTPLQIQSAPISETAGRSERETKKRLWGRVVSVLVTIVIILGAVLSVLIIFSRQSDGCSANTNGVTLYVDPDYQGHCHTFAPGDYDLAEFGLDQNVSSLKDPDKAYHITLIDRTNRPGYFDADTPQLPADWNDQAHSLRVEKHRPTTCHPAGLPPAPNIQIIPA